eukprot:g13025.t1
MAPGTTFIFEDLMEDGEDELIEVRRAEAGVLVAVIIGVLVFVVAATAVLCLCCRAGGEGTSSGVTKANPSPSAEAEALSGDYAKFSGNSGTLYDDYNFYEQQGGRGEAATTFGGYNCTQQYETRGTTQYDANPYGANYGSFEGATVTH